ncbi:sugar-binding transcriptional regulator [Brachybacterium sacelli]|uniref:DNA-binding transcriptional regulator LsrR (DeoR family) n=1 Tax=Brachybacterium sacelli TaxID=173364 RepID=A0ABS4WYT6_9MICO|nr:DNA-binding transcriptional regulator LsrR (DeoR family) [Brachybacterium sacelli]
MSASLSLDQQILHVYVAVQNLAHGRTVNEIAAEIGKSRFVTARMVRRARDLGLIEVRATVEDPIDVELSTRLAQSYGLQSALVVASRSAQVLEVRRAIASITARYLQDTVVEDDVLGFTPGRTLVLASRAVPSLPWADVVQLTGVGWSRLEDGVEVISNIGRATGGATYPLYVPILIDPEARPILRHPVIKEAMGRFRHATKAFLTIGGWPDSSLLAQILTESGEREAFEARGVVAEIGTNLLDIDGNSVSGLENRFIGISEKDLLDVPLRVAIGGGAGKERAVLATLRSGLAHVVITDVRSAELALVAQEG